MSFVSRVAAIAAVTFALCGIAQSAPGLAAELDRTPIAAAVPIVSVIPAVLTTTATIPTLTATPSVQSGSPAAQTVTVEAEPEKFDTLAEAVAAQDDGEADVAVRENLRCLAGAIYFESKGEPIEGQLAVAEVIMNRAKSGRFPPDVCDVVTQRGQFSFVRGGVIPSIDEGRPSYRTALAVAKVAMDKAWDSSAHGALFFHARRVAPSGRFVRVAAIGNHVFYR
ncbi:Cell Wall Hydrolase [Sphingomonas gellani]|uniref:Cell Wall Hydrolase n=1 Tax=Sphingomonas gellani TaxID=1166340 RepID=A0A1H8HGG0_9SPHN|nr:cell wall hydrolase [Sphingomonas gellani]SEN55074.1 Cell Wall Hydrolase [Sphingomonas gellani]